MSDSCDGCGRKFHDGELVCQITCDVEKTVTYLCSKCEQASRESLPEKPN